MLATDVFAVTAMWVKMSTNRRSKYMLGFLLSNYMWVLWRLQETLEWDLRWRQYHVPYVCLFTNTFFYLSQSEALYLFAFSSGWRFYAVFSPLKWQQKMKGGVLHRLVVPSVGVLVAAVCSALNILAALLTRDSSVLRLCRFPVLPDDLEKLVFSVKVASTLLVHVMPCCLVIGWNIALVSHSRHHFLQRQKSRFRHCASSTMKREQQKLKRNLVLCLISALLVLLCLPAPVIELWKACVVYLADGMADHNAHLADTFLCNLTVIAMLLNTLAGLRFSP